MDFSFPVLLRHSVLCRVMDKFKPGEVCNLVWGLAHLGCQPGADLLQQVVQASQDWSEVSCLLCFAVCCRCCCLLSAAVTGLPFLSAAVMGLYGETAAVVLVCLPFVSADHTFCLLLLG